MFHVNGLLRRNPLTYHLSFIIPEFYQATSIDDFLRDASEGSIEPTRFSVPFYHDCKGEAIIRFLSVGYSTGKSFQEIATQYISSVNKVVSESNTAENDATKKLRATMTELEEESKKLGNIPVEGMISDLNSSIRVDLTGLGRYRKKLSDGARLYHPKISFKPGKDEMPKLISFSLEGPPTIEENVDGKSETKFRPLTPAYT